MNRRTRRYTAGLTLLLLAGQANAGVNDATWGAADGDWNTALNWTGGVVPNDASFNVFITNGADVSYTAGGAITIDNLTVASGNSLRFDEAGNELLVNSLSTIGGRVLAQDGAVIDLGAGSLTGAGLEATRSIGGSNDAIIRSSATSYDGTNTSTTLLANGAGTRLEMSSLVAFNRQTNQFLATNITARAGGVVDLSNLTGFTDAAVANQGILNITADAGQVLLDSVTQIANRTNYVAVNGGQITGTLSQALNSSLKLGGGGSVLDFSGLTDVTGSSITATDGGTITLLAGVLIDDTDLTAVKSIGGTGNATLTSLATSWSGAANSRLFEANGSGTLLDLSALVSLTRITNRFQAHTIRARDGGLVDMSGLTAFTPNGLANEGQLNVLADGGTVDLSGITAIADRVHYQAINGGQIIGSLTHALDSALTLGGGSTLDFSALTDVTGSSITAQDGAVINLGAGVVINDTDLIAEQTIGGVGNARLNVGASAWEGAGNSRLLEADGPGTVLDMAALTHFKRHTNQFQTVTIRARDGGLVDLSALAAFTPSGGNEGQLNILADGGVVQLDNMTAIGDRVHFKAVNGGEISGALVTALDAAITLGGGGSVIDLSSLTDATGSTITVEDGGVIAFAAGVVLDDTDLIARVTINGNPNAALSSQRSSWIGGANARRIEADGAGTLVDLSALTTLVRLTSQFTSLTVRARDGGTVDLSALSAFTPSALTNQGGLALVADGAGSMLNLSALTALDQASLTITELGGVAIANLGELTRTTLTMDDTAGAADVHVASAFRLGDGAVVDMHGSPAALVVGSVGAITAGALNVLADGQLGGSGEVIGNVVNSGSVAPGNSPGTLAIDGDYTQLAGATLAIEIAALNDFDVLDISGSALLDGSVEFDFGTYLPDAGDEFIFLLATAGLGGTTFAGFTPLATNGFVLNIEYGADFAKLVVGAPVPLPPALWLLLSALMAIVSRRPRAA